MLVVGRLLLIGLGGLGAAWLLVVALLWLVQRQLIYVPFQEVPPAGAALPGSQAVVFETADGLRLGGWFLPAAGAGRRPTVLVCNGNAGNRAYRAPLAAALARAGLSVFLFDYRGYGGNPGQPTEAGLLADARAARAYLLTRDDVDSARLVYLGESLGAAVALALAVEQPPAALVLRSPFASLAEMGRQAFPWAPVEPLLLDRYSSIDRVGRLTAPLLVVAGERDRLIPAAQSRRLYERAVGPKQLVLIPGADHNDAALNWGEPFIAAVARFLDETAGLGVGAGGWRLGTGDGSR